MKKNDIIRIKITDMGVGGEGIGHVDGIALFVKNAVIGDEVRAVVTRLKKGYGYAKAIEIAEPSPVRVDPICPYAERCGGCQIMQLDYREQLKFKENMVRNNLERLGGQKGFRLNPIIGMDEPLHFRNKVQFPVGKGKDGSTVTGFYAGRTHYIVPAESCPVSEEPSDKVLEVLRQFMDSHNISAYDEGTGRGLVRHALIRTAAEAGAFMLCLVINGDELISEDGANAEAAFVSEVRDKINGCVSICLNINKENTNVILGRSTRCLYGTEYIEERIGDLKFRVSPLSFFQVNSRQTVRLYEKALECAGLTGSETVWDLYCGIGTISLFLARKAAMVYGVEIVPEAIANAKENAGLNGILNAQFFCGPSEKIFPEKARKADVVVVDPPRKGCDAALLDAIMQVAPDRIVYVSCDSATLARDIKILSQEYRLEEATPVDMFPHTVHCECVVLMSKV